MLAIAGNNRSVHGLIIEDGNTSNTQDLERDTAASSLISSSITSVKVEIQLNTQQMHHYKHRIHGSSLFGKEIVLHHVNLGGEKLSKIIS